ncbi:MAG: glycosyltransferase family 2 protein [Chloroflexota bacterium]
MTETNAGTPIQLSIILPAYNEEHGIADILDRIQAQIPSLREAGAAQVEVIVVDDGSRDGTSREVERYPSVRLLRHQTNYGYGAALKTGFGAARGEWLAFLDADGTYPPEAFAELYSQATRDDSDIVIGSRMLGHDSEMPLVRRVGNTIFAGLLSIVAARKISDSASGMRVFKRSILEEIYPLPDGLDFTPAMSTRAIHEGLSMVEVPISYKERVGASKLNPFSDGLRFLRSILWTATLYNPLGTFGVIGIALLALAVVLAVPPSLYYIQNRSLQENMIYRLFAVLILTVAGANVVAFGLTCRSVIGLLPSRRRLRSAPLRRWRGSLAGAGVVLVILGLGLMAPAVSEWLQTRQISSHWSYFAAGGTMVLTGLQLSTWFVLVVILSELAERDARTLRDLRHEPAGEPSPVRSTS